MEIHAAHGYLLHQFIVAIVQFKNGRIWFREPNSLDARGVRGSSIRMAKEFTLFVRISASDWADGGWNIEESVQLSKILKKRR
jgi:2,4-dienoyl-CoA reductase-like NADH-dependent reductase (Old Yellow Enzyme family)